MNLNLSGRFGLFELIVVVTLIGVLWATGARYYGQVLEGARATAFNTQARTFTSVVAMAHWSWAAGGTNVLPASATRDAAVLFDGRRLYVNRQGWPVYANPALFKQPLSAEACRQVWETIMQNPGYVRIKTDALSTDGVINVSVVQKSNCRYEVGTPSGKRHGFDYRVTDGQIEVFSGTL